MKIFLSGKVDAESGAWRDLILGKEYNWRRAGVLRPKWIVEETDPEVIAPWPLGKGWVFGDHDYAGPYRQIVPAEDADDAEHWGYFHGVTATGSHGQMDGSLMAKVVDRCFSAISQSDIVFAYINSPDAYGTLAEIGYALALGKFVSILIEPDTPFAYNDFSFVGAAVSKELYFGHYSHEPYSHEPEKTVIPAALKDAIVAYAGRKPAPPMPVQDRRLLESISDSFGQIEQWTSDPRVRGEARRIMRQLGVYE